MIFVINKIWRSGKVYTIHWRVQRRHSWVLADFDH